MKSASTHKKGLRTTYTHIGPKTAPQETPEETVHGKLGFTWRRQARERTESHFLLDLLDTVYEHFNHSVSARLQRSANRLNKRGKSSFTLKLILSTIRVKSLKHTSRF